MELLDATQTFTALGHPGRLSVFRMLMRLAPQGARPTEIANVLSMVPNTLSHHLADLTAAVSGAAAVGARLLVAPEVFFPGYNSSSIPALAQPRGGDWHRALSALCRETGCGLVVGYAERAGDVLAVAHGDQHAAE